MLRFLFTDIDDKTEEFCDPVSLVINKDENVPADDMVVVFSYISVKEQKSVVVYDDDKVVFTGIVDEQQTVCDYKSQYIKFVCRSMAGLLIDNESAPVSYCQPSADTIAMRHIIPYGLKLTDDLDITYFGVQTVSKGMSDYKAVEDFSRNALGVIPRINEYGQVQLQSNVQDSECVFSNDGDGIAYSYFCENIKRHKEISAVRIKVTNSCGYNSVVENKDAINRGIKRERYINSLYTSTPAAYAENMIKTGKENAYSITLRCPDRHLGVFLNKAVIKDRICAYDKGLYVSALRYELTQDKDVTTLTLLRKEV